MTTLPEDDQKNPFLDVSYIQSVDSLPRLHVHQVAPRRVERPSWSFLFQLLMPEWLTGGAESRGGQRFH